MIWNHHYPTFTLCLHRALCSSYKKHNSMQLKLGGSDQIRSTHSHKHMFASNNPKIWWIRSTHSQTHVCIHYIYLSFALQSCCINVALLPLPPDLNDNQSSLLAIEWGYWGDAIKESDQLNTTIIFFPHLRFFVDPPFCQCWHLQHSDKWARNIKNARNAKSA